MVLAHLKRGIRTGAEWGLQGRDSPPARAYIPAALRTESVAASRGIPRRLSRSPPPPMPWAAAQQTWPASCSASNYKHPFNARIWSTSFCPRQPLLPENSWFQTSPLSLLMSAFVLSLTGLPCRRESVPASQLERDGFVLSLSSQRGEEKP